tara:strand:+ start:1550 stop:3865 length:2316 start_codon:yes stop_codon:yes gene_type:complete
MSDNLNVHPFTGLLELSKRRQSIILAKRDYLQQNIPKTGNYLMEALEEGWEEHKTLKTKRQMRKSKTHSLMWEHKVWNLLASFDFEWINDIHFGKFDLDGIHQIDGFAYHEGIAIAIECKSKEKMGKQTIRKHLLEMEGYRKRAEQKIKEEWGQRTRIAWVLAHRNFIIPKADQKLAEDLGINLLKEGQINYFQDLFKRTGLVSQYQLLAELFKDIEIPELGVNVPAIKTKIGDHEAFIFAIHPSKLLPISYISHMGNQSVEDINAFQRMVVKGRLKQITSFIKDSNGFFPNSLLLNIDSRNKGANFMKMTGEDGVEFGSLKLPRFYKSAWVIDGQHRLLAFAETPQKDTLLVPVIAFHDLKPHIQSNMFVTINNKQKRVPQNIIIELDSSLKWGSPNVKEMIQALNARTMMNLNKKDESSLRGLIALTGENKKGKPFTTNTIVTAIRKLGLFGKEEKGAHSHGEFWIANSDPEKARVESVELVYEVISGYFEIFEDKCTNWNKHLLKEEGAFTMTNQGISALLLVLGDLVNEYCSKNNIHPRDYNSVEILKWIENWTSEMINYINDCDINKLINLRSRYGLQGQTEIKYILEGEIHKKCPDFNPKGLEEELNKLSDQWMNLADSMVDKMEESIASNVISILKENYGENENQWFYGEGIPQNTQKKVATKRIENGSTLEASFDILDWHSVVSAKQNYQEITAPIYSLKGYPNPGDSGREKTLSWFIYLNNIRKKVKHKVGKRVSEKEYLELKQIWEKLEPKILQSNDSLIN